MLRIPGKIPISIHPIFWLIGAIIGWVNSFSIVGTLIWLAVILVSILVHEFGHALTAVAFGQDARVDLVALGGLTYHTGKKIKLWQEFIVVLMGPFAGFLLFVLTYFIRSYFLISNPILYYFLTIFVYVNLFWTIVNLLPVLPLDGGQLLRIIMESIFGYKGLKITLCIGIILGVGLGILFFTLGAFIIGAIFLLLAFESFTSWKYFKNMTVEDHREDLQALLKEGEAALMDKMYDRALKIFSRVRSHASKGILFIEATEKMALIYYEQGYKKQAYEFLESIKKNLKIDGKLLLQKLAYENRDFKLTLDLGTKCFQDTRTYEIAVLNALASARLDQGKVSVGWLECAIHEGMPSIKEIIAKSDFDQIRDDPYFINFLKHYSL